MSMHHIVAFVCLMIVSPVFSVLGPAPEDTSAYPTEEQYPTTTLSGKQSLIIPIQTHLLAPSLFYCIKATACELLLASVVEPYSFCRDRSFSKIIIVRPISLITSEE